jgi:hypothetical protein
MNDASPPAPSAVATLNGYLADSRRLFDQADALLQQARAQLAALDRLGGDGDPVGLTCTKAKMASQIREGFARELYALWAKGAGPINPETPP